MFSFILYKIIKHIAQQKEINYYLLPQGKYHHNHVLIKQASQFYGNYISMKKIIGI